MKSGKVDELLRRRGKLAAYGSADDGETWAGGLMLDERGTVSYPDEFEAPDGLIHIVYDRNRKAGGAILMAKLREADVPAGRFGSPGATERLLVSRPLKGKPAAAAMPAARPSR